MIIKILIAFSIGAALWRLGGWGKWLGKAPRRYILPAIITLYAVSKKRKWWTLGLLPILIGAFSLGYGEKHPYWFKFIVGCAWIAPRYAFLGFSWYPLAIPLIWLGLFKLSNTEPYSRVFRWSLVEIVVGGLVGVAYII